MADVRVADGIVTVYLSDAESAAIDAWAHGMMTTSSPIPHRRWQVDPTRDPVVVNIQSKRAEFAAAALLGVPTAPMTIGGADAGYDFTVGAWRIDVKWTTYRDGHLLYDFAGGANLATPTRPFKCDVGILVVPAGDDGGLRLAGWITRDGFYARCRKMPLNWGDCLGVGQDTLYPMMDLKTLIVSRTVQSHGYAIGSDMVRAMFAADVFARMPVDAMIVAVELQVGRGKGGARIE